jgi:hypothetical protein
MQMFRPLRSSGSLGCISYTVRVIKGTEADKTAMKPEKIDIVVLVASLLVLFTIHGTKHGKVYAHAFFIQDVQLE